jgi:hypothetical protein
VQPVPADEAMEIESRRYNLYIKYGGNAIYVPVLEAIEGNPLTRLALQKLITSSGDIKLLT